MQKWTLSLGGLLILVSSLLILAACGAKVTPTPTPIPPTPTPKPLELTIYSGRSESLVKPLIDQFAKASGVNVKVRYGGTAELAATILEEGKNSPADVYYAQDPGGLGAVEHLLATIPDSILNQVNAKFRSPQGKWVGLSGRARVVVYNTQKLKESDLPDDIWDFTDPKWQGRIGWAPTNASFQAMVTAMRVLWGEDKTRQWLAGIKANKPKVCSGNTQVVTAVGSGEVEVGFPNHYYLFTFLAQQGESFPVRNYHPRAGGPGAVILVSGAGILDTSRNKEAAQRFLDFALSPVAQQYFAGKTYEYPVVQGVTTHPLLKPLTDIKGPEIGMAQMSDLKGTLDQLRQTGVIP